MFTEALRRRAVPTLGAVTLMAMVPFGVAEASKSKAKYDEDGPRTVLRSSLAGSLPTDPTVFGVLPGTTVWAIKRGTTRLKADGALTVRVRGLVITSAPNNGTNPVPTLSASVYCSGALVATTATAPFSTKGNARIDTDIGTLPSPCVAPTVFVHPNATVARYIAFNGSR